MVRTDVSESIGTLTIDRPEVKNALDLETVNAVRAALNALAVNAEVGVLIITGGGETAFVSGADINDIRARGRDEATPTGQLQIRGRELAKRILPRACCHLLT